MNPSEINDVITAPEWSDSIEEPSVSTMTVRAVDHLDGIEPEMIEWWFTNMDAELYFQFHPCDHKKFAWTRNKTSETHVGATHLTYHQYGGGDKLLRSEITFMEPAEFFDDTLYEKYDVGMALFAIVHMVDENDVPEAEEAGRFVHVAIKRDYGTELRSCWWLNVNAQSDKELMSVGRLRHVHEEFGYLQGFLRSLFPRLK
jgi:hypothetical protein